MLVTREPAGPADRRLPSDRLTAHQDRVAIDRYLTAFERGTMDEKLVADRLTELRAKSKQLRVRRDELTLALDDEPAMPEPATLAAVADHIGEIITNGIHNQIKALVEAWSPRSPSPIPTGSSRSSASPNPAATTGPHPPYQRKRPRTEWLAQ